MKYLRFSNKRKPSPAANAVLIQAVLLLSGPLFAVSGSPGGILNSFEGEVWMNGVPVSPIHSGTAAPQVGREIRTGEGMAELLLTPGSFLRLGNRSELTLNDMSMPEVRARLGNGEALLEVLSLRTPIILEQDGATAVIRKPGLYNFNAKRSLIAVYSGELQVDKGGKRVIVGKGFGARTRRLREAQTKPDPGNPLYSWSKIRDEQLSSESAASAQTYPGGAGGWHGPAWYWNPWSASYTFLSASGFVTGPFGWPYYSPGYAPDYVPVHRGGDSWPYGPPVLTGPEPMQMPGPRPINRPPAVPLTAPGVPGFPNNRFR